MAILPPETPQAAAARKALYSQWMTADGMAETLGVSLARVIEMRRAKELLCVWVHEHQEYRFPTFQLYKGKPNADMPRLLGLLADVSKSGWGWIEWFVSCRTLLAGSRPADLLAEGRFDEVLEAAVTETSRHPDALW